MPFPPVPKTIAEFFAGSQAALTLSAPREPDNPLIHANDAFFRLTGYGPDDIIGRNCRILQGPDTEARSRRLIRRSLDTGFDSQAIITNYRKSGEMFENFLFIFPVLGGDDRPVFFIGSQFQVPEVDRVKSLMTHAEALKTGIEALNAERQARREQPISCAGLAGVSAKSLVAARLAAAV